MGFINKVGSRLRRDAGVSMERTYLYGREASASPVPEITSPVPLHIARVRADELQQLVALGPDEHEEWMSRMLRGDACYGAWVESKLVHYSWVQTSGEHSIETAGIDLPIRPGELWIYNCRTSNEHRGLKIYPRVLQHIMRERFAEGAVVAWIYTAEHNVASQRGVERAGFTRVRTLRALRLGRMYRALSSEPAQALQPPRT